MQKTMTAKAIAANRENARKSTGPRRTQAVSQNARTDGLLAKKLLFQSDEEKSDFEQLHCELEQDRQPVGPVERALVEEAAVCLWKLQSANGWEMRELDNRRAASTAIMKTLSESHEQERLPLFTKWDGKASAAQLGWDCEELVVRCDKRDFKQEGESSGDRKSKAGNLQIEAKLTTSLDSILRYQAVIKRDLYRVLAELREMQRERREEG
jgi:hypothetical protein